MRRSYTASPPPRSSYCQRANATFCPSPLAVCGVALVWRRARRCHHCCQRASAVTTLLIAFPARCAGRLASVYHLPRAQQEGLSFHSHVGRGGGLFPTRLRTRLRQAEKDETAQPGARDGPGRTGTGRCPGDGSGPICREAPPRISFFSFALISCRYYQVDALIDKVSLDQSGFGPARVPYRFLQTIRPILFTPSFTL